MGLAFHHVPVQRESLLPDNMGSGVGVGDFANDGFAELDFVKICASILPDAPSPPMECGGYDYRNLSGVRFEDVTDNAGFRPRIRAARNDRLR